MDSRKESQNKEAFATTTSKSEDLNAPAKVRKKPGRKPNPQSPAIRKAQNRAAQRAFRERKERHLRELEVALRQIRDQRDSVLKENNKLKADVDSYRVENWYLKGVVLTLQLVCYEKNLVIPHHSPYLSEPALSIMAQSMPQSIAAYLDLNAHNKLPVPSKLVVPIPIPESVVDSSALADFTSREGSDSILSGCIPSCLATDRCLFDDFDFDLQDTIDPSELDRFVNEQASLNIPELEDKDLSPVLSHFDHIEDNYRDIDMDENSCSVSSNRSSSDISYTSKVPSSPLFHQSIFDSKLKVDEMANIPPSPPSTCSQSPAVSEAQPPPMSAIAAIQALRIKLRLRILTDDERASSQDLQPTILQLSIPHDPRIDLVPAAHMRDRMIIYRDCFDMDACFNLLVRQAQFRGGNPSDPYNWELPAEFFEKYWFLTINYDLKRTNRWKCLQVLNDLSLFDNSLEPIVDTAGGNTTIHGANSHSRTSIDVGLELHSSEVSTSEFPCQQFDSVMMDNQYYHALENNI